MCGLTKMDKITKFFQEKGPDLKEVNFNEILDIFKEKNRRIRL